MLVETSDPVEPLLEIPIRAASTEVVDTQDPFGNDDGLYEDSGGSSLYTTCGCSSTSTSGSVLSMVGLLGLMTLRRRRG